NALLGTAQHDATSWECDIGKVKVRSHDRAIGIGVRTLDPAHGPALDSPIPSESVGDHRPVTDVQTVTIGLGPLRAAPPGMPDPTIAPPVIAEAGDPFTAVRVLDLLARVERGVPIRIADIVDRLNATYTDWLFTAPVVADVAVQLQANWMTDYRNSSGIVIEDAPLRPTIPI